MSIPFVDVKLVIVTGTCILILKLTICLYFQSFGCHGNQIDSGIFVNFMWLVEAKKHSITTLYTSVKFKKCFVQAIFKI